MLLTTKIDFCHIFTRTTLHSQVLILVPSDHSMKPGHNLNMIWVIKWEKVTFQQYSSTQFIAVQWSGAN